MSNMSEGEKAFAATFQFAPFVLAKDREELRDFLYKYAHNFDEAKEYLQLLKQTDSIDVDSKSELLFRIQGMALQCFPLAMRRLTDNISKRSLQKLVTKIVREEFKTDEINKIKTIHSHYKIYLDKGVAHQDELSIQEILQAFPNTEVINADMEYLETLYNKLTKETCTRYIDISKSPTNYEPGLKKLI